MASEAVQEAALEALLQGVADKWSEVEFVVKPHNNHKDVAILDGFADMLTLLEDSNISMMTASASRCAPNTRHSAHCSARLSLACRSVPCSGPTCKLNVACRFIAGIQSEFDTLQQSLQLLSETLDEYMELQRAWMYLEPIFSAQDIQRQLPEESRQFTAVDKQYKAVVAAVRDRPKAMQTFTSPALLKTLKGCNETLENVQVRNFSCIKCA